jgi:hypothetical protein
MNKNNKKSKKRNRQRCKRNVTKHKKRIGGWEKDEKFLEITEKIGRLDFDKYMFVHLKLWLHNVKTKLLQWPTATDEVDPPLILSRFDEIISITDEEKAETFYDKLFQLLHDLPRDLLVDDYDYSLPKYSFVNENTTFLRRRFSKKNIMNQTYSSNKNVWLDYSSSYKESFLVHKIDENEETAQNRFEEIVNYFGNYVGKVNPKKELFIFHFPDAIPSFLEGKSRKDCTMVYSMYCAGSAYNDYKIVDGYTHDFLTYNPNDIFKDLPSLEGYREICVYDYSNLVHEPVESVTTLQSPVTKPVLPSNSSGDVVGTEVSRVSSEEAVRDRISLPQPPVLPQTPILNSILTRGLKPNPK